MLRLRTAAFKQPDEIYRPASTYFTRRLKFAATAALFNQIFEEHIHNFRSPTQPNLNWDAVKEVYRTAGVLVIGKPLRRHKPYMSDSTWALIAMRNNLKKHIERKASIKLKTEKLSEALDVTRGHTLRNWLKRQHLSVIWEKFIKSPRS